MQYSVLVRNCQMTGGGLARVAYGWEILARLRKLNSRCFKDATWAQNKRYECRLRCKHYNGVLRDKRTRRKLDLFAGCPPKRGLPNREK
jgi:hypothetical protein